MQIVATTQIKKQVKLSSKSYVQKRLFSHIPEIDFSNFNSNKLEIAKQVRSACSGVGFMYVKNVDGLDQSLIDKCLSQTERFFGLHPNKKNEIHTSENNPKGYYKYVGNGMQGDNIEAFLLGNNSLNLSDLRKDYFNKMKMPEENWKSSPTNKLNQWPREEELFKQTMLEYWQGCSIASNTILRAIAVSLDLEEEYFVKLHDKQDSSMELKKYPAVLRPQLNSSKLPPHLRGLNIKNNNNEAQMEAGEMRVNEHSDLSSITLLIQTPNIDCLEVKNTDNEWLTARAYPNTILINTGDIMERWTNGTYLSTRHRVVAPRDTTMQTLNRYSVVYFCMPNWETEVKPLSKFESLSTPHPSYLFGELIPFY